MIELSHEQLVPLGQVPRLLPPRPNGKRIHVSAVYRWTKRGVRGVRLESIRVGGTTYTSREALQRFAETNSAAARAPEPPLPPAQRIRRAETAHREARAIFGSPRR